MWPVGYICRERLYFSRFSIRTNFVDFIIRNDFCPIKLYPIGPRYISQRVKSDR